MMGTLYPLSLYGSPVAFLKFQMAPRLTLLMSSGSKKEEPRYTRLSEARSPHSQRMRAEVSSYAQKDSENGPSNLVTDIPCRFCIQCMNCTFTNSSPLSRFHAPTADALQFSGNHLHRHMTSYAQKDSENGSSNLVTDFPCRFCIQCMNCSFTTSSPL